ncbi:DUF618-domain-containing protein, partial [Metschnikowia bicuspidata var. bicuspidata NRRL YB-4993]
SMSFSPEIFRNKLDALQETQDSIVSLSQWVLFHHRHASHLCELWADYALQTSAGAPLKKKLSLLYLCNDVVQQARHKRKPEFIAGFAARLPAVLHALYGAVDEPVKPKVERLISVWNERSVFTKPQIENMQHAVLQAKDGQAFDPADAPDAGLKALLKAAAPPRIAPQLAPVNGLFLHMAQLLATASANVAHAHQQAQLYLPDDPSALDALPLPKVYVSKLNVLEKLCLMTVQTLEDAQTARRDIVAALADLSREVLAGLPPDTLQIELLQQKLERVRSTRAELLDMVDELLLQGVNSSVEHPSPAEEPSPVFDTSPDTAPSASDSLVPTYEDSSDSDSDADLPPAKRVAALLDEPPAQKKRRVSDASLSSATSKKSVAFSEEIEVKEFERDDQANYMDIIGDAGADDDDDDDNNNLPANDTHGFEIHHKDAVELMHERESEPGPGHSDESLSAPDPDKGDLLSLLSKLA